MSPLASSLTCRAPFRPSPWVLAVLWCGVTGAALAEDSPLYLTLSHSLRLESNFSRNADKQPETINTTTLGVGIDKNFGRQTYRLAAELGKQEYRHYTNLQNDPKNASASVSSGIGANWSATLGGSYSQNLNPIQNNTDALRVTRNLRTYADQNLAVRYGNGGRLSFIGTLDANQLDFSEPVYRYQNADQRSQGLRAVYTSSDLLSLSLGLRLVKTNYPFNNNDQVTDHNVDFTANWQPTALSATQLFLSHHNSQYQVNNRSTQGLTGALSWDYTPRGLLSYSASLVRSNGSDRSLVQYADNSLPALAGIKANTFDYNTLTDTANLSARWQMTGKVSSTLAYSYNRYDLQNTLVDITQTGTNAPLSSQYNSHYRSVSLSANYDAARWLKLGCGLSRFDQSQDIYRIAYTGRAAECNANLRFE